MKLKVGKLVTVTAMAFMLCTASMVGCVNSTNTTAAAGGVLCLKVNPEIAISYDAQGNVTSLAARNPEAQAILDSYTGYEGKQCKVVVNELVTKIGQAGYYVDEVDGSARKITIEIESGSTMPNDVFMDEVVSEARTSLNDNKWNGQLNVSGTVNQQDTDYGIGNDGITDYDNTDYGMNGDGITDYTTVAPTTTAPTTVAPTTKAPVTSAPTTRATTRATTAARVDTDYGPGNDGVTDYGNTDYGPNSDGVTDYNSGNTNYSSGNSNYSSGNSNYGNSNYGD